jgi:transposase InsO family protein
MHHTTDKVVIKFLEEHIFSRFGCPKKIITDNAKAFSSVALIDFCSDNHVSLGHSTAYYPQGNGLAESTNKNLVKIIKKILGQNKRNWDSQLKYALWEDRISTKREIGTSPFQLVYGLDAILLVQLGTPVMKILQDICEEPNDLQRRIYQLIQVHENMRNS